MNLSSTFRLPDVIIAGEQKCGTKSLLVFLLAHPDIIGDRKEYHFTDTGDFLQDFHAFLGQMNTAIDNFDDDKILVSKTGLSAVKKIEEGFSRLSASIGSKVQPSYVHPIIPIWAKKVWFRIISFKSL